MWCTWGCDERPRLREVRCPRYRATTQRAMNDRDSEDLDAPFSTPRFHTRRRF